MLVLIVGPCKWLGTGTELWYEVKVFFCFEQPNGIQHNNNFGSWIQVLLDSFAILLSSENIMKYLILNILKNNIRL